MSKSLGWRVGLGLLLTLPWVLSAAAQNVVTYSNGHSVATATTSDSILTREQEAMNLVNNLRLSNGIGALIGDYNMRLIARGNSKHLGTHNYFAHVNPEGDGHSGRMKRAGLGGIDQTWSGENLGAGYTTPLEVFTGWSGSPGHRANMLNSNFKRGGIGYQYVVGSTFSRYWTHNFVGSYTGNVPLPRAPGKASGLSPNNWASVSSPVPLDWYSLVYTETYEVAVWYWQNGAWRYHATFRPATSSMLYWAPYRWTYYAFQVRGSNYLGSGAWSDWAYFYVP